MKTIKVKDLNSYGKLIHKLALEIKKSGQCKYCYDSGNTGFKGFICGECCGKGYILKYKAVYSPDNPMLAFLLSKELGIELITEWESDYAYNFRSLNESKILIVSDIINTGKTREQYKDFDFACLFMRTYHEFAGSKRKTFYIKFLDEYKTKVVMPWEVV